MVKSAMLEVHVNPETGEALDCSAAAEGRRVSYLKGRILGAWLEEKGSLAKAEA
jgi:hypothetical protein